METTSQVEAVRSLTNKELITIVLQLQKDVEELKAKSVAQTPKSDVKEMTDDDAKRILNGDLASKKHKEAAEVLGLTYGQVYSCRLEFTFKNVHKELKASGFKNTWVK